MSRLALLAAAVLLALSCAARCQDDGEIETALERVLRDQSRIGLRLEGLAQKMERLAARYEDEGRTRNASLLRDALDELHKRELLPLSAELERNLEAGNLSTVEQQDQLAAALEDIYALLRDRRDVDDLSSQADLARQGVAELGFLAQNERRLLSETRAASDQPAELLEQALAEAEKLAVALDSADQATATALSAEQAMGDAALAGSLAEKQRDLADEPDARAATEALLESALSMLREHLEQPAGDAPEGAVAADLLATAEAAREQARAAASRAAAEMAAARQALQRAETGETGETGATGATGAKGESGESGESGEPRPAGESGEPSPSGETSGESADGEHQPASDARAEARERMLAAADELDATREALERSERSLAAARNRARAMATASSRDAAAGSEQLEELAQRLEAVQPEEGPELLDRTRALLEELSKMAKSAGSGDLASAQARQPGAETSLNELLAMLRQRAEQAAGDEPTPPPDAAALAALADRQADLEQRMRELMERLKDLPDQAFRQPMEQSGQSMAAAEGALRSGNSDEGTQREREAAENLEQAQAKLAGERDRYEQLRQEEVLFRLGEELTALLDAHEAARVETAELDAERAGNDRLGRSQRRAVSRLSGVERDLGSQADTLRTALEEDGAIAFTYALSRTRDDLASVAAELGDEQTGALVQSMQDDISQRLRDLQVVLDEERERRRNAPTEEPQPGEPSNGEMKPQLVPTVAELLLIQRMEQAALSRLQRFVQLNPEIRDADQYGDLERELLVRWATEHDEVSSMFRAMVAAEQGQGAGGHAAGDEAGGDEAGGEPPPEPEPAPDQGGG